MELASGFQVAKEKWLSDWRKIKMGQQKLSEIWRDSSYQRLMDRFWYDTESQANSVSTEMEQLNSIIEQVQRNVK